MYMISCTIHVKMSIFTKKKKEDFNIILYFIFWIEGESRGKRDLFDRELVKLKRGEKERGMSQRLCGSNDVKEANQHL